MTFTLPKMSYTKCECIGGYVGDPYNFSQELKDACQCPGKHVSEIHSSKCKCPASYNGILTIFLKIQNMLNNVLVSMCLKSIKCKCPVGYDGDPYNFPQDLKDACQCPGEHVFEIHSSKCKCPSGYDGDPYNFSQES